VKHYAKRSRLALGYRQHLGGSSASAARGGCGGMIRREKRSKAARNLHLARRWVGLNLAGRALEWAVGGILFTSNPLGGSLVERWGQKEKRQVRLESTVELSSRRRSRGHHVGDCAAMCELARQPPTPASHAPTGAHSSASIPCTSCPHWSSLIQPPSPTPLLGSQS
jgi:hypothetical protein